MNDDLIRTSMTAAGMLMEDLSAKVLLDPLASERVDELRALANQLLVIAEVVEVCRRGRI